MYEAYFGLANQPFCIAPDSRFYVDAAPHRAAIRALQDRLGHGDDFMPLIGEFGAGKTIVGRRMLEEIDRAGHVAAELPHVRIDGDQLFDRVAEALGMRRAGAVPPLGGVIRQLEELVRDGRDALLLVDEADQLDVATLRRLRKLTAVRVDGRAALRVCLVGRSTPSGLVELQRIGQPLNIGAPVRVEPLDAAGTHEYILARLGRAGWLGRPAFDEPTTAAIHAHCMGNPGRVNRLCGHILLQLYMQDRDDVNPAVVRAVDELLQAELNGEPATLALPPRAPAAPVPDPLTAPAPAVIADGPPPVRAPDTGLAVPAQEAANDAHGVGPRRRGLAQGVAALALLVSGGFLWQMISNLAAAGSESTRQAAAPMRTAPPTPAPAGPAAMAEQVIAQAPPGAGPTTSVAPPPVAALTTPRSAAARRVAATAACTLEGETLGLCSRSRPREPVRVAARAPVLEPASDPPAEAVPTPPLRPACEPARAALGLCPENQRAAR
jgi:general secretion pathway protein A